MTNQKDEPKNNQENTGKYNIQTINGEAISVGDYSTAFVANTSGQNNMAEIKNLLDELRREIEKASIPQGSKNVMLRALPEMEEAVQSNNNPSDKFSTGLTRINDQLEGVGAVADNAAGIAEKVFKIAKSIGLGVKTVAPYLANLFG